MRVCVLSDDKITEFDPSPFLKGYDWELVTVTPGGTRPPVALV